jgi:urease accessory protein UreF
VLWHLHPVIERVGREAAARGPEELWSFTPGIDVQGMLHEQLPMRLFRS